jgi:hypothetical protein
MYGKGMLTVAFDSSMWIIKIPLMGVSCFVESIAGKMGLFRIQNVTICMGVSFNPTAGFQPTTHVRSLGMMNALDTARIQTFCP